MRGPKEGRFGRTSLTLIDVYLSGDGGSSVMVQTANCCGTDSSSWNAGADRSFLRSAHLRGPLVGSGWMISSSPCGALSGMLTHATATVRNCGSPELRSIVADLVTTMFCTPVV